MTDELNIPNFELDREIGRGGMARVYLARQLAPKRNVAVKIVAPQPGDDPTFLQTLKQEGDTVAQFSHENIVTVYACGVEDNHYYLAMEILSGGDLSEKIKQGLDTSTTLEVLRQMASALEHAHQRNTLHRDIKPENILFHDSGKAVLVDFGIAKDADSESNFTKAGAVVGTPHYMAPERAQGKPIDARSDLYALGVLFYEMLTGEKMYRGNDTFAISYAHVYEPIPALPDELRRFQPLLNSLVAKDPDDRVQTAGMLVNAIDQLSEAASPANETVVVSDVEAYIPTQSRKPAAARSEGQSRKSPLILATVGIAVVAGALAIAMGVFDSSRPDANATISSSADKLTIEKRVEVARLMAAAESMARIGDFAGAENLYAKVLGEFDCSNREARSGLKSTNEARYEEIVSVCP